MEFIAASVRGPNFVKDAHSRRRRNPFRYLLEPLVSQQILPLKVSSIIASQSTGNLLPFTCDTKRHWKRLHLKDL